MLREKRKRQETFIIFRSLSFRVNVLQYLVIFINSNVENLKHNDMWFFSLRYFFLLRLLHLAYSSYIYNPTLKIFHVQKERGKKVSLWNIALMTRSCCVNGEGGGIAGKTHIGILGSRSQYALKAAYVKCNNMLLKKICKCNGFCRSLLSNVNFYQKWTSHTPSRVACQKKILWRIVPRPLLETYSHSASSFWVSPFTYEHFPRRSFILPNACSTAFEIIHMWKVYIYTLVYFTINTRAKLYTTLFTAYPLEMSELSKEKTN